LFLAQACLSGTDGQRHAHTRPFPAARARQQTLSNRVTAMLRTRALAFFFSLSFLLLAMGLPRAAPAKNEKDEWPPITPEELAMKDDPANPGAPAIILNREEHTDDLEDFQTEYYRIKVLTDEGRKYADIEIPFVKDVTTIEDLKARTVRPDGTAVDFKGQVFEKTVIKTGGLKFLAKAFTLPDVQVGSIIEYKYKARRPPWTRYTTSWILPRELTTRRAHFSLRPYAGRAIVWTWSGGCATRRARVSLRPSAGRAIAWTWSGLPANKAPERRKDETVHLELENIPAFPEEEYMPPADMLKPHVAFFYLSSFPGEKEVKTPDDFWKQFGKWVHKGTEEFIGEHKAVKRVVAEIVNPADPPDAKLRKLYARVQQIRNLSSEQSKTEKEEKQEKLKDNQDVEDVLKHGYGSGPEINVLFVALARASGIDAAMLYVTDRRRWFFQPNLLRWGQLSASVVQARVGSQDVFLDPGTRFCPYGLLPWGATDAKGLRPEKDGGVFVTSPNPRSTDAVFERKGVLQLDREGTLQGKAEVTFVGQEALRRRWENRDSDAAGRRKALEDEVKSWLPAGSSVELKDAPDWEQAAQSLRAEFQIRVPNFGVFTGHRVLLTPGVFQASRQYPFQSSTRVHPIYFAYPLQELDEVTIEIPEGYQVESLPTPRSKAFPFCRYGISRRSEGGKLRLERRLVMDGYFFPVEKYSALRVFYDAVRAGDEEQVVLKAVEGGQAK